MAFSVQIDRNNITKSLIEDSGGKWQHKFSFKDTANIYPFSKTLKTFIENDAAQTVIGKKSYGEFLKSIPSVTFRAYYPNTALYEIFTVLGKMGFSGSLKDFKLESIEKFFGDAARIIKGLSRPGALNEVSKNIVGSVQKFPGKDDSIYNLPYALYYQLVSTTNNALYEVPCGLPTNLLDSNGSYGWSQGNDFNVLNPSSFLKHLTNMFHFTIMPFFSPGSGGDGGDSFSIGFDLVNDTADAAIANYQFVQTLMLNNKWLQYGIGQLPGSVYDVKIVGGQRYFMCTGDFKITPKGVMRSVANLDKNFKPYGKETRIPDVYSLELSFRSLLPSNLNNYLFGVAQQTGGLVENGGDNSVMSTVLTNLTTVLKKIGDEEYGLDQIQDDSNGDQELQKINEESKDAAVERASNDPTIAVEARKAAKEATEKEAEEYEKLNGTKMPERDKQEFEAKVFSDKEKELQQQRTKQFYEEERTKRFNSLKPEDKEAIGKVITQNKPSTPDADPDALFEQ